MRRNGSTVMRRQLLMTLSFTGLVTVIVATRLSTAEPAPGAPAPGLARQAIRALDRPVLGFEANQGQTDHRVRFLSRGRGYTLFLTPDEAVLVLREPGRSKGRMGQSSDTLQANRSSAARVVRMRLVGGNPSARLVGTGEMAGRSNYLTGPDRNKWCTGVPRFARVKYEGVYPGVDLVFYGREGQLEYDFVVAPDSDPGKIRIAFEGTDKLRLDADGNLVLHAGKGEIVQRAPRIYQDLGGSRTVIAGRHVLRGKHEVVFKLDAAYDRTRPLVIDPVLAYSTYLGGSMESDGAGIAIDSSGAMYLTGSTFSPDFPTRNPLQPARSVYHDAFVTKLTPDGHDLVYSTYLGGNNTDAGGAIAVDTAGSAYVVGYTWSTDFPVANAGQPGLAGQDDAFLVKLDPSGSALTYSTYLGGQGYDIGFAVALDASGAVYVAGSTTSLDFPTVNALQDTLRGRDAFVTKLTSAGNEIAYSTYLGGNNSDYAQAIALDSEGNTYVTGSTASTDFPVVNAYQPSLAGSSDAFVIKLDPSGSALAYSTYLGGKGIESGYGIAVDAMGAAYLTGETNSPDFPVATPLKQTNDGYSDAFVTKLDPTGSALVYSTYLGGSSNVTVGRAIAVDASGHAYVAGYTYSSDFPAVRSLGTSGGSSDAFIAKLIPTGDALVYSTTLGGTVWDGAHAIALDGSGTAYITGEAESTNFPTVNPFQADNRGNAGSAFAAKLADEAPDPAPVTRPSGGRVEQDDPAVSLSSGWNVITNPGHSGGSAVMRQIPNSRAVITFSGTGVKWIGYRDEWSGIAAVYLDNVFQGNVDTYASPSQSQAVLFSVEGLTQGIHTFAVEATGTHNEATNQAWVWVDAFDVIGGSNPPPPPPAETGRLEQDNPANDVSQMPKLNPCGRIRAYVPLQG